jgi:hypothetical protein
MSATALKHMYDIACVGSDLTSGGNSTQWVSDLERALQQYADRPVRCYDCGLIGQTSSWGAANTSIAARLRPKLILFEGFGFYDIAAGLTRIQHAANIDAMITGFQSAAPGSRLCIQTMNPGVATDIPRANVGDYYVDEAAKAVQWGIDSLNHYINWPSPLPPALAAAGSYPTRAANRQYFFPTLVSYVVPLILSAG